MTRYSLISWGLTLLPLIYALSMTRVKSVWWLENLASFLLIPAAAYILLILIFVYLQQFQQALICVILLSLWLIHSNNKIHWMPIKTPADCEENLQLLQYNLRYFNPELSLIIDLIKQQPLDFILLQEVDPVNGELFIAALAEEYPYMIGGQAKIGYPGGQLIFSRHPLLNVRVLRNVEGFSMTQGIIQLDKNLILPFITAHPPSPRSKTLWLQRNRLISEIQALANNAPLEIQLIMGDINLAAGTSRFESLFPDHQSRPLPSWPVLMTPLQKLAIAIDHLWVKGAIRICRREAKTWGRYSDHRAIQTSLMIYNRSDKTE
ncbi:MAG: endonuclease/exonuclease/phosphatase family protein [Pseudomonadales bacterium]|nr:endonuclease/exonuclease/phosphatase family protein [Pseudomonadales bacterium]